MKRKLPNGFKDVTLEIEFFYKLPKPEELESDAVIYNFDFSLHHIASVNWLFNKCVEFLREDVVKANYRNCAGSTYFIDVMLKYLYDTFPYYSNIRMKLSSMVDQIVKSIYNWIRYEDRFLFNVRCARQSVAIDFVDYIAITGRGTINYAKTAERLLCAPKFTDFDRLKIVCVHCLERYLVPNLKCVPMPEDVSKVYQGTVQIINFWKGCLQRGEFTDGRYSVNEHIINTVGWNTEALKLLWSKLCDDDKACILLKLIRKSEVDFQCYLLSQMNGDQQQLVFKNYGGVILNNMFGNFIWGDYLLVTAYHSRNVIPSRQYYEFMKRILFNMQFNKNRYNNELIFRQLWLYATKRIKDLIFKYENAEIFYWFRNEVTVDYLLPLFSDASADFKKNFIWSESCINAFMELIKTDKLAIMDTLVSKTFANDVKGIAEFKKKLLNHDQFDEIICHVVSVGDKQRFNTIMAWIFANEEEIEAYKQRLVHSTGLMEEFKEILNRAVFRNRQPRNELMLEELDSKIGWFSSSYEKVKSFKETVLAKSPIFSNIIYELVKLEAYELIDELLWWCLRDLRRRTDFRMNLYSDKTQSQNVDLVSKLIWKNDDFTSLDKFVEWCFGKDVEGTRKFKMSILRTFKEAHQLWGSILFREQFQLATDLIKWCGITNERDIFDYKNEMILNLDLDYITNDVKYFLESREGETFGITEDESLLKCLKLITWLAPSAETYKKYESFVYFNEMKYRKFYNLIRVYLQDNEVDGFV